MQTIHTINTNVATVDNGQRVIVDVVNRAVVVARSMCGYLAMAGRLAPLAALERLLGLFEAALRGLFAVWCYRHVLAAPTPAGKPAGCGGTTTLASGGSLSRRLGSLAG